MSVCAIGGRINVQETSWWDDLTDWAEETWDDITGTAADTSESTPAPAAASGCGLFVGATAPDEQDAQVEEDGADADIDGADADADDTPTEDAPDIPDGEDGDAPNVCDHAPTSPTLEYPTSDLTGVSVQPVLNCSDSTDGDSVVGDTLSYRFRIFSDSTCTTAIREWTEAASEHLVLPADALDFDTDYWFNTEAIDTCPTPVISTPNCSHFHTALPGVCNNDPGVFDLSSPADGITGQPILPTFGWGGAAPIDAGDTITYTLIISLNSDCSSPVRSIPGIGTTSRTLLPGQELSEGEHYYWMVIATDSCGRTRGSTSIRSFTTLVSCTSFNINDGTLSMGTITNLDSWSVPGDLLLNRSWNYCWHASSGILPGSPFSLNDPAGGGIPALPATDITTGEMAIILDSQTANLNAYYRYQWPTSGLDAITGSAFLIRARLHSNESPTSIGFESSFEIADNAWIFGLGITRTGIRENASTPAGVYTMSGTTPMIVSHTYRGELAGTTYTVYIDEDGSPALAGTRNMASGGANEVNVGDNGGNPDGVFYINDFCIHNSYQVPVSSPGNYETEVIDLGTASNNIGSGATVTFVATTPPGTSVNVQTRTGPVSVPDGSWTPYTPLGALGVINSPADRYIQIRFELSSSNYNVCVFKEYTLAGCTY